MEKGRIEKGRIEEGRIGKGRMENALTGTRSKGSTVAQG
jgi:hypothetical protein